ncbi:MAG TPA: HAMP domain-containing sensor histidine kinase [Xanthobacteraceae bacterium]|nr:HAMP domain-containing sensor histidine kinase [Xanthobacteraceae bacterium]
MGQAPARMRDRIGLPTLFGLSGKLLVLTILFVMLTGVLVYVPTIANFRLAWLQDRLAAAHTAALVLEAAPSGMVPESLSHDILDSVGARAVALKKGQQRRLLAMADPLPQVVQDIDVRSVSWFQAVYDAFETLIHDDNDIIRVVGPGPVGADFVEIVVEEGPLRQAMMDFSINVLLLTLFISTASAALVFLSLNYLFVRPMRHITAEMVAFRREPENPARILAPSERRDEIGVAERELSAMQQDLVSMLNQKSRLAALGLAVSKVSHDLRGLLASAQLASDHLSGSPDPTVQRFAPKLMRALERAIDFCQSTLAYGRAQEPAPDRRMILLEPLVEEVRETLGLGPESAIRWVSAIERGLRVDADQDQLFRILMNLGRNAMQALEARAPNDPARDQIRVTGRREGAVVVIEVADTGPGVSPKAREHLFEAFQGSTTAGGTGLGLAIAAELVQAHAGDIHLVDGTIGATFHITLPDRAVELGARRRAKASQAKWRRA